VLSSSMNFVGWPESDPDGFLCICIAGGQQRGGRVRGGSSTTAAPELWRGEQRVTNLARVGMSVCEVCVSHPRALPRACVAVPGTRTVGSLPRLGRKCARVGKHQESDNGLFSTFEQGWPQGGGPRLLSWQKGRTHPRPPCSAGRHTAAARWKQSCWRWRRPGTVTESQPTSACRPFPNRLHAAGALPATWPATRCSARLI